MAGPLVADRVAQVSTTTGTGALSLDPAVASTMRGFASVIGNGNSCFYCISHQSADEWEVGIGTVTDAATDTLSRDTVLSSSNAGALVDLTAGTKDVFVIAPAGYGTPLVEDKTAFWVRRMDESTGSTVGNARGNFANDLQHARSGAAQVASGNYSSILGGQNNQVTGAGGFTAGYNSVVSAIHCVGLGGKGNTVNQNYCALLGGQSNGAGGSLRSAVFGGSGNSTLSADVWVGGGVGNVAGSGGHHSVPGGSNNATGTLAAAVAFGSRASAVGRGQVALAAGRFAANGDAQSSQNVIFRSTTNATPAELLFNGSSGRTTVASDTSFAFEILVVARRSDANGESAAYLFRGGIDRNAAANTTALVGAVQKTVIAEDTAAWDANVTADSTNGALIVTVTGEAGKTVRWVAHLRTTETTG
jgi:hypothetical protein